MSKDDIAALIARLRKYTGTGFVVDDAQEAADALEAQVARIAVLEAQGAGGREPAGYFTKLKTGIFHQVHPDAKGGLDVIPLFAAANGADSAQADGFYLATFKDGRSKGVMTWWGPDNAGYTPYLEQAGIYTAEQIAAEPTYYDNEYTVPVPASFLSGRDSRQVDVGLTKNGHVFWSAKNLRSALTKPAEKQERL
jgi:hypothetical protein